MFYVTYAITILRISLIHEQISSTAPKAPRAQRRGMQALRLHVCERLLLGRDTLYAAFWNL